MKMAGNPSDRSFPLFEMVIIFPSSRYKVALLKIVGSNIYSPLPGHVTFNPRAAMAHQLDIDPKSSLPGMPPGALA